MNLRSTTPTPENNPNSSPSAAPKPPPSAAPKSTNGRLFTEEHELELLKAYKHALKKDTLSTPSSLSLAKFNQFTEDQIYGKIKKLRQKYREMSRSKSKIKTPHDRKIYIISRKIWSKNPENKNAENGKSLKSQVGEWFKGMIGEDGFEDGNFQKRNGVVSETSPVSKNGENGKNLKPQVGEWFKGMIDEDGMDFEDGNFQKGSGVVSETSPVFKNGENGKNLKSKGVVSKMGIGILDLEKYPFLKEMISEEVKRIGEFYFEGLGRLGEEKLKDLDEKWMVLSLQKTEIETHRALLLQNQFITVAHATRKVV